ncbi:peptidase E [Aggregatimonas sangjinii]|uniref:Peptidase E n=1 Tax=Aggregatimonas sangjinii TaxID=2583587 RepID=A0A5B7ST64_9FLAO|nr:peptidase E [Aggregatimonas sangjinii]QCX01727.1 peptidase E [Aggregatimonas sangjinii]
MKQQLFIYGSGRLVPAFVNYTAEITGKPKPNICFVPTASGDDPEYIAKWEAVCSELDLVPHVLRVWINSYDQQQTYEEIIGKMDAIIVGGGNTLNMLAIWEAQGITDLLKKAYENGVVMGGGSAGSLCWFNGGTTDSRPKELSIVGGLGLIDKSHCPHYNSEKSRRPLYHENILKGALTDGYAVDDRAAIHFVDGTVEEALSLEDDNHSYYVSVQDGLIREERLKERRLG